MRKSRKTLQDMVSNKCEKPICGEQNSELHSKINHVIDKAEREMQGKSDLPELPVGFLVPRV